MSHTETPLERSARVACGSAAARHGESTPGQWDDLADWAGYSTWSAMLEALEGRHDVRPEAHARPPIATTLECAIVSVDRRATWERNSRPGSDRRPHR